MGDGTQTSDAAVATIAAYAAALGKTAIVMRECPGFLVNRILSADLLGFLRAVYDGADYLQVDRVMEAFGWPMGPAYLQDVVGLDTLLSVLASICSGFPDRMRLDFPHAVHVLTGLRRFGQKSGSGFYRYESDPKVRPRKSVDPKVAELLASVQPNGGRPYSDIELRERLMLPMIIEAQGAPKRGWWRLPPKSTWGSFWVWAFPACRGTGRQKEGQAHFLSAFCPAFTFAQLIE
jgi:3-hydroxyacyl-CoA dehydrogenase/enoyl-CoA hydratase/3-hydroxybutyryl-CoA epimerase/enoyl-CoA isomerase